MATTYAELPRFGLDDFDLQPRRIDSLEHELLNIYGTDHAFVLEALNHYRRLDGGAVTLRAVAFTDRNEAGLVTSARIYTDTSPLFAPKE